MIICIKIRRITRRVTGRRITSRIKENPGVTRRRTPGNLIRSARIKRLLEGELIREKSSPMK
jgi:hypothetical protein